ncbi:hypothetical protein GE21DRAFT_1250339 [Neurospora crassa]|nr:hypothetical protein GE21DRAFT_1250339 [Neurospora crassa]
MTRLVGEEEQAHASFPLSIVIRGSRVRIGSDTGRDGPSEELEILRRARRYVTSAPRESDSGSPFRHPSTCVTRCKLDMIVGNMYILLKSQARLVRASEPIRRPVPAERTYNRPSRAVTACYWASQNRTKPLKYNDFGAIRLQILIEIIHRWKHHGLGRDNLNTKTSLESPTEEPGYIYYAATAHSIIGRYQSYFHGIHDYALGKVRACEICPGTDATYLSASQRRSTLWTGRRMVNATKLRCRACQLWFLDGVSLRDVSLANSRLDVHYATQPGLDTIEPDELEPMALLATSA